MEKGFTDDGANEFGSVQCTRDGMAEEAAVEEEEEEEEKVEKVEDPEDGVTMAESRRTRRNEREKERSGWLAGEEVKRGKEVGEGRKGIAAASCTLASGGGVLIRRRRRSSGR